MLLKKLFRKFFHLHYEIGHKSKKPRVGVAAKRYKKYPSNFG